MYLSRVKLSNIMGIEEMEFQAGKFIEISGKNGAGKTSIIEAIKSALQKGNDVTVLRNGAAVGEVCLEFDNDVIVQKTYKDKANLKVTENGKKVNAGQTYLDSLYDMLSINPIEFLTTPEKDRAKVLLDTISIEISDEEIEEILSGYASETVDKDKEFLYKPKDGLEKLERIRKAVFEERTVINRSLKEKQATINQLQESIQSFEVIPGALEGQIEELENKQKGRITLKETYIENFNKELQDKNEQVNAEEKAFIEELNKEKEAFLAKLNAKREDKLAEFAIVRLNN